MAGITKHLEIAISDAEAGRISKDHLLEIFQEAIDNGDILEAENELSVALAVLPLVDEGVLRPSAHIDTFEERINRMAQYEIARIRIQKARRGQWAIRAMLLFLVVAFIIGLATTWWLVSVISGLLILPVLWLCAVWTCFFTEVTFLAAYRTELAHSGSREAAFRAAIKVFRGRRPFDVLTDAEIDRVVQLILAAAHPQDAARIWRVVDRMGDAICLTDGTLFAELEGQVRRKTSK
jgi:hypothetical protein